MTQAKQKSRSPSKLDVCAPQQARGQRTMERIVDAVVRLLNEKSFEHITISEIIVAAQTNTGSFYARFKSKDAVLPYIYERYNADLHKEISGHIKSVKWDELAFEDAVKTIVGLAVKTPTDQPWLFRAMSIFARQNPNLVAESAIARSSQIYEIARRAFAPHHRKIKHADPDRAIYFAMFTTVTSARERMLFPDSPLARALAISTTEFIGGLEQQLSSYLRMEPST